MEDLQGLKGISARTAEAILGEAIELGWISEPTRQGLGGKRTTYRLNLES